MAVTLYQYYMCYAYHYRTPYHRNPNKTTIDGHGNLETENEVMAVSFYQYYMCYAYHYRTPYHRNPNKTTIDGHGNLETENEVMAVSFYQYYMCNVYCKIADHQTPIKVPLMDMASIRMKSCLYLLPLLHV